MGLNPALPRPSFTSQRFSFSVHNVGTTDRAVQGLNEMACVRRAHNKSLQRITGTQCIVVSIVVTEKSPLQGSRFRSVVLSGWQSWFMDWDGNGGRTLGSM